MTIDHIVKNCTAYSINYCVFGNGQEIPYCTQYIFYNVIHCSGCEKTALQEKNTGGQGTGEYPGGNPVFSVYLMYTVLNGTTHQGIDCRKHQGIHPEYPGESVENLGYPYARVDPTVAIFERKKGIQKSILCMKRVLVYTHLGIFFLLFSRCEDTLCS